MLLLVGDLRKVQNGSKGIERRHAEFFSVSFTLSLSLH